MLCPVCEGQQLYEDEVTGQIICSECGAATGVFQNHTLSQQFVTLRGLRAAAVTDDLRPFISQNKPADGQYATSALVSRSELFDSLSNAALKLENEDMTQQFVATPGLLGPSEQSGGHWKKRTDLIRRPWRLSEPLTYLMRRQTKQLSGLLQFAPAWKSRLEDAVWRLWLTYLAVTGELGEEAWILASRRSARSAASLLRLCDTVHGLALTKTTSSGGGCRRPGRPKLRDVCCEQRKLTASNTLLGCNCRTQSVPADKVKQMGWLLVQNRLAHFLWAGWGGLYEPGEGRQTRDLAFIGLVNRDENSPSKTAKASSLKRRSGGGRRQSQSKEIGNTETVSEAEDQQDEDKEDRTRKGHCLRRKRKRTLSESELLDSSQEMEDQELADAEFDPVPGIGDRPMPTEFSKAELVALLLEPEPAARRDGIVDGEGGSSPAADEEVNRLGHRVSAWKTYLTRKLAEQSDPWQRLFWHGQLNGQTRQLSLLLEHNLAILFLAYLSAAPARRALNPLPWQVHQVASASAPNDSPGWRAGPHHQSFGPSGLLAVSHMITIRDICEMCTKRQLVFSSCDDHFPPGVYSFFDSLLLRRLKRNQPPSASTLARVTMQLLHMTGIYHLPKFPLAWLAHRHVIAFGLPDLVFRVVRVLIRRLHLQLTHSVDKLAGPSLLCSVPWSRALRPEVFAMALVIVALRLTFKLDDVTEYRLSQLARLLNRRKCRSPRGRERSSPASALHFDWIAWAVHLSDRFNSDTVSLTTPSKTTVQEDGVSAAGKGGGTESPLDCWGVAASATDTTSSSVDCLTKMASAPQKPPVLAACHISDLLNVHCTTDFLGSHEFRPDKDVGWGENVMQIRPFSARNVKTALTRPLRDCYAQANGRTGASPAASHHDNDGDLYPPGHQWSAASSRQPPLATRFSRLEQEGWESPFRSAQLWYLTDSTATTTDHLPIPCASVSGRSKKKHGGIPAPLAAWADQFWRQQRSAYQPVCQGPWAYGSVDSMAAKDRKRVRLPRKLPEQLIRLLHRHSQFLAEGMFPDNGHCEETNDAAAEGADKQAPEPKTSPSQSLQWLLRLACIICGASGVRHLVLELNTVEHLLGLAVHTNINDGRVRRLNLFSLAMASCFDLNDHLPSVEEHLLSVSAEVKCEEQPGATERRSR